MATYYIPRDFAGGNIPVNEGDIFIIESTAAGNITFQSASGSPTHFAVQFSNSNSNALNIQFNSNLTPSIHISDGVGLPATNIDASNADAIDMTIGNGVTINEYKGSNNQDTIQIGDNFTSTKDFKTGSGDDFIRVGQNASVPRFDMQSGNDTIVSEDPNITTANTENIFTPDGIVEGTNSADVMGAGFRDGDYDEVDGVDGNDDIIYGLGGADTIHAGAGNDVVYGDRAIPLPASAPGTVKAAVSIDSGGNFELNVDQISQRNSVDVTITDSTDQAINSIHLRRAGADEGENDVFQIDLTTFVDNFSITIADEDQDDSIVLIGTKTMVDNGNGSFTFTYDGADNATHSVTVTPGAARLYSPGTESGENDVIDGGDGDDILYGDGGDDSLTGGSGADYLDGGIGNDTLEGGLGDDTLNGQAGDDRLTGGDGNDVFEFELGNDTITDFNAGNSGSLGDGITTNNDFIDLSQYYGSLHVLRADQADDGILNQSNTVDDRGNIVDYSGYKQFGANSLTIFGATSSSYSYDNTGIVCFTAGTRIRTPAGDVDIATLKQGDLVCTLDNGAQPIAWVGSRTVCGDELAEFPNLLPVRINKGVLGAERDIFVSRQHGMLMPGGRLARAIHLVDELPGVRIAKGKKSVTYVHLMFEAHQIIVAEGTLSESFFPGPQALKMLAPVELLRLLSRFPAFGYIDSLDTAVLRYGKMVRTFMARKEVSALCQQLKNSTEDLKPAIVSTVGLPHEPTMTNNRSHVHAAPKRMRMTTVRRCVEHRTVPNKGHWRPDLTRRRLLLAS